MRILTLLIPKSNRSSCIINRIEILIIYNDNTHELLGLLRKYLSFGTVTLPAHIIFIKYEFKLSLISAYILQPFYTSFGCIGKGTHSIVYVRINETRVNKMHTSDAIVDSSLHLVIIPCLLCARIRV